MAGYRNEANVKEQKCSQCVWCHRPVNVGTRLCCHLLNESLTTFLHLYVLFRIGFCLKTTHFLFLCNFFCNINAVRFSKDKKHFIFKMFLYLINLWTACSTIYFISYTLSLVQCLCQLSVKTVSSSSDLTMHINLPDCLIIVIGLTKASATNDAGADCVCSSGSQMKVLLGSHAVEILPLCLRAF